MRGNIVQTFLHFSRLTNEIQGSNGHKNFIAMTKQKIIRIESLGEKHTKMIVDKQSLKIKAIELYSTYRCMGFFEMYNWLLHAQTKNDLELRIKCIKYSPLCLTKTVKGLYLWIKDRH